MNIWKWRTQVVTAYRDVWLQQRHEALVLEGIQNAKHRAVSPDTGEEMDTLVRAAGSSSSLDGAGGEPPNETFSGLVLGPS